MLAMWQSNGAAITDIIAFSGKKKNIFTTCPPLFKPMIHQYRQHSSCKQWIMQKTDRQLH